MSANGAIFITPTVLSRQCTSEWSSSSAVSAPTRPVTAQPTSDTLPRSTTGKFSGSGTFFFPRSGSGFVESGSRPGFLYRQWLTNSLSSDTICLCQRSETSEAVFQANCEVIDMSDEIQDQNIELRLTFVFVVVFRTYSHGTEHR
jgi:hypothetical protein